MLSALSEASRKSFTGSITYSSLGHDVAVFCEDGNVVAVHSPSFEPPVVTYLRWRTGVDLGGRNDPLADAYDQQLIDADTIDTIARDWAYGLLASAVTWDKPKIKHTKRVTVTKNVFGDSTWARVSADVSGRVSDLVSSWSTITEYLEQLGFEPRPAAHACTRLTVMIPEHPLFTGEAPIDAIAQRTGQSRYAILRELAHTLLAGPQDVEFGVAEPVISATAIVPEALENPAAEWASLEAIGREGSTGGTPAPFPVEPPPAPVVELAPPEPQPLPAPEAEPVSTYVEPEPFEDVQPEIAQVADLAVVAPARTDLEVGAPSSIALRDWVNASPPGIKRTVHEAILERVLSSAVEQTRIALDELEVAAQAMVSALAERERLAGALDVAEGELAAAQEEVSRAARALTDAEARAQQVFEAEAAANERARLSAEQSTRAEHDLEQARAAVLAREAELAAARDRQRDDEAAAAELREKARGEVQDDLAAARGEVERVETSILRPATERTAEATQAAEAGQQAAEDAHQEVGRTGTKAEVAVEVTAELEDGALEATVPLQARLEDLRALVVAALSGSPAQPAEVSAPQVAQIAASVDDLEDTAGEGDELDDLEDPVEGEVPAPMPAPVPVLDLSAYLPGAGHQDHDEQPHEDQGEQSALMDFDDVLSGAEVPAVPGVDISKVQWDAVTGSEQDRTA